MIKKQLYEAPATEVLELRLEGTVLFSSTETPNSSGEDLEGWDS